MTAYEKSMQTIVEFNDKLWKANSILTKALEASRVALKEARGMALDAKDGDNDQFFSDTINTIDEAISMNNRMVRMNASEKQEAVW